MTDGHGRKIDYIRISITDRCNLRCVYCMPKEGIELVGHEQILSYDEILRLAKIFAGLGIRKIKITGGEPLVRKGVAALIEELKKIDGIGQVTLTTNGILLAEQMEALAKAGLDGVNVSLDTLDPEVFYRITRRRDFERVMEGFAEALCYPDVGLKVNCVPMGMKGQNVLELASLARQYPVHVRYIEMMPIGLGRQFACLGEEEILRGLLEKYGPYEECKERLGNGPGHYVSFSGFQGKIGFISAISHKFCDSCNRIRLTSQGFLKTCLQYEIGVDLRALLRGGAADSEIEAAIRGAIGQKPAGHQFLSKPDVQGETHMMSQIGG